MKFQVSREALLTPLQRVAGAIERRHTTPILSNVLIENTATDLSLTGSDGEIELVAHIPLRYQADPGAITVPAKKLIDICRSFANDAQIECVLDNDKLFIKAGRSRFSLSTLAASDFPRVDDVSADSSYSIAANDLLQLLESTYFSMAQQDVRYFLNGVLLEISDGCIHSVATDGHRLAWARLPFSEAEQSRSIIVPRKGILDLMRLLQDADEALSLKLTANHICVSSQSYRFISKLIEGQFPSYQPIVGQVHDKVLRIERELLKESLSRVAILSNEKHRGVRLLLRANKLIINTNNPEQEEAEEQLEVDYQHTELDICFNVTYLLDVLSAVSAEDIELHFTDENSSLKLVSPGDDACLYVIMPMQI